MNTERKTENGERKDKNALDAFIELDIQDHAWTGAARLIKAYKIAVKERQEEEYMELVICRMTSKDQFEMYLGVANNPHIVKFLNIPREHPFIEALQRIIDKSSTTANKDEQEEIENAIGEELFKINKEIDPSLDIMEFIEYASMISAFSQFKEKRTEITVKEFLDKRKDTCCQHTAGLKEELNTLLV